MTTYCAPCLADLALVRDAVTQVAGTASCMAHAVLLTHVADDPGRRRQRLDALRALAAGKAEHADPVEQARLELLVQEYGLAGAMDMGGPSRRQQGQQGQQRPVRQGGQHRDGLQQGGQHRDAPGLGGGGTAEEARRPKSRRGRQRPGDRPEGSEQVRPDGGRLEGGASDGGALDSAAPTRDRSAASEIAPVTETPSSPGAATTEAPSAPAPATSPSAPAPAASPSAPPAPAAAPSTQGADSPAAPVSSQPDS